MEGFAIVRHKRGQHLASLMSRNDGYPRAMVVHHGLLDALCYKEIEFSVFPSFPRVICTKLTKRQSSMGFCYSGTYCFVKKEKTKKIQCLINCVLLFIPAVC